MTPGLTSSSASRPTRFLGPLLWALLSAWALAEAVRWMLRLGPQVAGVDFYTYVTIARDTLSPEGASESRFGYFPGVFTFWAFVIRTLGEDLSSLRRAYALVLGLNALLCGRLVSRSVRAPWSALCAFVLAASAYVLLAVSLEGFIGATEPIATLPVLAGLLVWDGASPAGRQGVLRAAALGLGLGVAVFVKQQAALVALGWVALLPGAWGKSAPQGPTQAQRGLELLVVPAAALAGMLCCFALSVGLGPLTRGLAFARAYAVGKDLSTSSSAIAIALAGALGLSLLGVLLARKLLARPPPALAAFALTGGLAALAQLGVRPYKHYALLAVPLVVVALGLFLLEALGVARAEEGTSVGTPPAPSPGPAPAVRAGPWRALRAPLAGLIALGAFAQLLDSDRELLTPSWPEGTAAVQELAELRGWLQAGTPLLLLPPRRYAVHYFLGTRADRGPLDYFWPSPDPARASRLLSDVRDVMVVHAVDESDLAAERGFGVQAALARLEDAGFVRVYQGTSLELWRKGAR